MTRPQTTHRFTVTVRRQRLRVRVVPYSVDVNRAWRTGAHGRIGRGEKLHGFFQPQLRGALGELVLAEREALREIVPHECAHAAIAALRRRQAVAWPEPLQVDDAAEEYVATMTGLFTRAVLARLDALGVELR